MTKLWTSQTTLTPDAYRCLHVYTIVPDKAEQKHEHVTMLCDAPATAQGIVRLTTRCWLCYWFSRCRKAWITHHLISFLAKTLISTCFHGSFCHLMLCELFHACSLCQKSSLRGWLSSFLYKLRHIASLWEVHHILVEPPFKLDTHKDTICSHHRHLQQAATLV